MLAKIASAALNGIDSIPVEVQGAVTRGLPAIEIVGLAETAVRESRVRVKSALEASAIELAQVHFVLNLAPAEVRKSSAGLDLPIALGLLVAAEQIPPVRLFDTLVVGELSLDGELKPVRGCLAHLLAARQQGLRQAIVPADNASEASLVPDIEARSARHLRDVLQHLLGHAELPRALGEPTPTASAPAGPDMQDVRGQPAAKRALEVAAAGGHNLLMVGPPGAGKTMLASRLSPLLPEPSEQEALEIATIQSATGNRVAGDLRAVRRPYRAPHHSVSHAALIGGGHPIRPGEVTLAHGGVLFLDELPELGRQALESLRPTMESGRACVSRARQSANWPAAPLVVAAMNPCPCGFSTDPRRVCRCTPEAVERYRGRVSGPLLDRFDMHVALGPVDARTLREGQPGEASEQIRARVSAARQRAADSPHGKDLSQLCAQASADSLSLLDRAVERLGLSVRAYVKALRVARTVSLLAGSPRVEAEHAAEAIQYRLLDRDNQRTTGVKLSA